MLLISLYRPIDGRTFSDIDASEPLGSPPVAFLEHRPLTSRSRTRWRSVHAMSFPGKQWPHVHTPQISFGRSCPSLFRAGEAYTYPSLLSPSGRFLHLPDAPIFRRRRFDHFAQSHRVEATPGRHRERVSARFYQTPFPVLQTQPCAEWNYHQETCPAFPLHYLSIRKNHRNSLTAQSIEKPSNQGKHSSPYSRGASSK